MKPRLLVAEPDRALFEDYRLFFEEHGFEVRHVAHGAECLKLLRRYVPHAAVIDHDLPCPGGKRVVEWLCEEERLRSIPVLLTSGSDTVDACHCGTQCRSPVVAHFLKPFRMTALLETLYSDMPELLLEQCYEQAGASV